jgi:nucleotide-binding universal stress UspA family protein
MTDLPRRVLVATDGSEHATLAVRAAADLSNRADTELHVVHVRKPLPVQSSLSRPAYFNRVFEEYADLFEEETGQLMRRQVFRAEAEGADVADAHLREGRAAEEITGMARKLMADLVVVGSRGVGPLERLVKGSVSERVVRLATCPTLVVRGEKDAWPPSRLVVGDDFSAEARKAGEMAAAIGAVFGVPTVLVSAYRPLSNYSPTFPPSALMYGDVPWELEEALKVRAAELERMSGARAGVRVASGNPAAVIQGATEEGDWPTLTAVGSRGLGAARRVVLGSVSTRVLRAANGPVLIVPPSSSSSYRAQRDPDRRFA